MDRRYLGNLKFSFRENALTVCLYLDAEEACADGGMLAHPLDLSYLGVQTIWTEDLGRLIQQLHPKWATIDA